MSNAVSKQDHVTNAADKLMKKLLDKANAEDADVDFSIQVMQTCSRYLAVKGRINVPDEENAFDGFRDQLSGEREDRGGGGTANRNPSAEDDRGADLPSTGDASWPRARSSTCSPSVRETRSPTAAESDGIGLATAPFTITGVHDADLKPGGHYKTSSR